MPSRAIEAVFRRFPNTPAHQPAERGGREALTVAQERLCIAPAQWGPETALRTALARTWKSIFGMRGEPSVWPPASLQAAGCAAVVEVVQWSVISPMPAYSRTAAMPATASALVSKGLETAMMVPSGAVSRNLNADSASTNSSNIPAIAILSVCGILRPHLCRQTGKRHRCLRFP
jgi:hypothetical protein